MKYLRYPESEAFAAQVRARVWNSAQLLIDLCIPCTARQRNAFGDAGRGAREGGGGGDTGGFEFEYILVMTRRFFLWFWYWMCPR